MTLRRISRAVVPVIARHLPTALVFAFGLITFALGSATAQPPFAFAGCSFGPATSCVDPISATYISGSWIQDDSSSEWTLTADYAPPGGSGTVTGSVLVFPPPDAWTCPVFTYTANGYLSPTSPTGGAEGSSDFRWDATNPNPNISCSGYTPVQLMVFEGHRNSGGGIANKGNDLGTGQWTSSNGLSGPLTVETNLVLTPTGETFYPFTYYDSNGWGGDGSSPFRTQLDLMQSSQDTLSYDPPDPNLNKFQGRQVYEASNGLVTDECYDNVDPAFQSQNQTLRAKILGSVWNVGWGWGNANDYGPDNMGFSTVSIDFYRAHSTIPCSVVIPQAVYIVNNIPGYGDQLFATHTLSWTIESTSVTVQKDSYVVSRAY